MFCVRADDRDAATAWTPAVTRHGEVTVAVTDGGDRERACAVRDLVAAALERDAASGSRSPCGARSPSSAAGPGDPELITVKGRRLLAARRRGGGRPAGARHAAGRAAARTWSSSTPPRSRTGRRWRRRRSTGSSSSGPWPAQVRGPAQGRRPVRLRPRRRGGDRVRRGGRAGAGRARGDQLDRGARRWPASRSPTAAWRTSSPSSPGTCRRTARSRWWTGPRWPGCAAPWWC